MSHTSRHYHLIARAITYYTTHWKAQPDVAAVADYVAMSASNFQRLFRQWAGISPDRFRLLITAHRLGQALRFHQQLDHVQLAARNGLKSASSVYDHTIRVFAMTPAQWRQKGANVQIYGGSAWTPFGKMQIFATTQGICRLEFGDDFIASKVRMQRILPSAAIVTDHDQIAALTTQIFSDQQQDFALHLFGTNFQLQVWQALLLIPYHHVSSYGAIARYLAIPKGARAVGRAIGDNPISYLIPCHRVIAQSGALTGYRWGLPRKQALLAWEAARASDTTLGDG